MKHDKAYEPIRLDVLVHMQMFLHLCFHYFMVSNDFITNK